MKQILYSRKQLAERWGYDTTKVIEAMEKKGALTPIPKFDGVRYHIEQIESIEAEGLEISPLSPLERRRLEKTIERLERENETLHERLNSIRVAGGFWWNKQISCRSYSL